MAVNLHIPENDQIFAVAGVDIGTSHAGIKNKHNKDLTVFRFSPGTQVAGVFTRNRFRAAPVQICENSLRCGNDIRALLINTGNANAGTGIDGVERALQTRKALALELGLTAEQVLPFSTGVIMQALPHEKIIKAIPAAVKDLNAHHWFEAAHSIMTTDTLPKISSRQFTLNGRVITITGISKGAGMIKPNMATMLSFVATDAEIDCELLKQMTTEIANQSFNRITVDGDTSTNDSFIIAATAQSGLEITPQAPYFQEFKQHLLDICLDLAKKIIRDAEGATKLITLHVTDAGNQDEALKVAYAIAHSPLVKTAFYASDANLGRILAAIGYAGIDDLDPNTIKLWIGDVLVSSQGGLQPDYTEDSIHHLMQANEIDVTVSLGRGHHTEIVYTCDLSHEYISINADYRT
ncbi:bifunctional glutamate N-acetyltransferase/amino-acid acetyltransferase ArgJ [Brackiella oedipodis]|uniref:bifunctional glutamate N-acetyltransferase/amino-acid acetyltransferase ArgJ n=1 Tax=Brackiella oedipodis TaxID=124225 RepID=UPI00048B5AFA|nr:bifunctional glutamate N-acetyltransferase/amino-acid acetyltransferase ArgJ [Brackiella oedipodis]